MRQLPIRAMSDSERSGEGLARSDGNEVAIFAIQNSPSLVVEGEQIAEENLFEKQVFGG